MQEEDHSYYVHPTAVVESQAIGEGTKIWHFAHVRQGSKIGKSCNIGKSVYIDIDAELVEEHVAHGRVVVLAGVDEHRRDVPAVQLGLQRGDLHEVGARPDHQEHRTVRRRVRSPRRRRVEAQAGGCCVHEGRSLPRDRVA